jgi:hypothetical protein
VTGNTDLTLCTHRELRAHIRTLRDLLQRERERSDTLQRALDAQQHQSQAAWRRLITGTTHD